jgi:catechol 2,3-dioxygenase-like lactoylglutathione lyase family enzyme
MERAISFYSDVLGLRLTSRDVVARFEIDGVLFGLVPSRDEKNVRGGGNARLCALELSDEALLMLRKDLVQISRKLNAISAGETSTRSPARVESYVV